MPFTRRTPRTLRATLAAATVLPVAFIAALFLGTVIGNQLVNPDAAAVVDATRTGAPAATAGPTLAERIAHRHGCWTGDDHPADAIPGHAVVTFPGDTAPTYAPADAGFAMWLGPDNRPGTGDEAPGHLTAFCP